MSDPIPQPPAILIVDDDSATLRLLTFYVRKLAPAYDILTAEDAQSALSQLADRTILLLITDYMLSDMDGIQLAVAVKAITPLTYVILTSAYKPTELTHRAREQQVDLFLSKLDLLASMGEVLLSILPPPSAAPQPML